MHHVLFGHAFSWADPPAVKVSRGIRLGTSLSGRRILDIGGRRSTLSMHEAPFLLPMIEAIIKGRKERGAGNTLSDVWCTCYAVE